MAKPGTIAAVKGFRDVLPDESRRWQAFEDAAVVLFSRYGFGEIRLPTLERTDLFARSLGETTDVVEKEMYSFVDRDDTSVTLRPEATAGAVRAYLETGLASTDPTARLFYRGPMFRRERPQRGRYRQFYQIGAELFGRQDPLADAELLVMLMRYLALVGAHGVRLQLNSVGDAACRPAYRDRLREFGRQHLAGLCPDCHRRLERNPLRIFDCKVESCQAIVARAPLVTGSLCEACRTHLAGVRTLLDQEGVAYELAPRLVRGLDYYVRTAFEIVAEGLGAQNAVGGGGRYDGLVAALGGPDVPGVGFAIGVERLAMTIGDAGGAGRGPDAMILPLEERAVAPALHLATALRDQGVAVELEPAGRSLKALLRSADRRGARLAVILGEDELRTRHATVRDLARREDRRQALAFDAPGSELAQTVRALVAAGT
jgi:histidyl-tRNA synthetase